VVGVVESPVVGPQGNREFLLYARRSGAGEEAPRVRTSRGARKGSAAVSKDARSCFSGYIIKRQ